MKDFSTNLIINNNNLQLFSLGCRSLICDSNGIIIAEMVYRCMVCANISDSIADAQRHYQLKHILNQNLINNSAMNNNYNWKTNSANSSRSSNSSSLAQIKNKELQQQILKKQSNYHYFHNLNNFVNISLSLFSS